MAWKVITCDCGFLVQSDRDDELVWVLQRHAREVHTMELTRDQVLAMAQPSASGRP